MFVSTRRKSTGTPYAIPNASKTGSMRHHGRASPPSNTESSMDRGWLAKSSLVRNTAMLNHVQFPKNLPEGTKVCGMTRARNQVFAQCGLEVEEFDVRVRDGAPIRLRSYRPSSIRIEHHPPLLLYMHGGGFVTGGLETDDSTCRAIALAIPIVVINVEYRLAPEHKFPTGFEDCFDIVRWVCIHPRVFRDFLLIRCSRPHQLTARLG